MVQKSPSTINLCAVALGFLAIIVVVPEVTFAVNRNASDKGGAIITPKNVDQMTPIGAFGRGIFTDLIYAPDGSRLAVATTTGIWLYQTSDLRAAPHYLDHGGIASLAYSPDGRFLAASSSRFGVKVWDAQTGELMRTFTDDLSGGVRLRFSPDSSLLSGIDADAGRIIFWHFPEVRRGSILRVDTDTHGGITGVAYSPDSRQLAISFNRIDFFGRDTYHELWLWDTVTGAVIKKIDLEDEHRKLIYSTDGRWLIGNSRDGISLWDRDSEMRHVAMQDRAARQIAALAISPDGLLIASASQNAVHLWDISNRKLIQALPPRNVKAASELVFSPDGEFLAARTDRGLVRIWDVAERSQTRAIGDEIHGAMRSMAFNSDWTQLATGTGDNVVRVWDVASGDNQITFDDFSMPVVQLARSQDDNFLAIRSDNGQISVRDTRSLDEIYHFQGDDNFVSGMTFSPDSTKLAAGIQDRIIIRDVSSGTEITTLRTRRDNISALGFSPDGSLLVSGSLDHTIMVWDANAQTPRYLLRGHEAGVSALAFSGDGNLLASSSYRALPRGDASTLRIWDVASGKSLYVLDHADFINAIAFNPGDSLLASGGAKLILWDIQNTRRGQVLDDYGMRRITALAFSADGALLATGSDDKLRIWDVQTRELLVSFDHHTTTVSGVTFSSDGKFLVTASGDGSVVVWGIRG